MGRIARILDRLEAVLELAEHWLARYAARPLDAATTERHLAFRWDARYGSGRLIPVAEPHSVDLDDLVGVEASVAELVRNTEQLVRGLPAQHVLLYGERGTGKSSAIKGLLARFGAQGLRLVEVRKQDLLDLPDLIAALRELPYSFVLFCDDLAFDEGEAGMRELKAALDGSIEATPGNVRLVATSNRRHLLPRRAKDNADAHLDEAGELHVGEANEEKLSLADRFGLVLGFFSPNQETYLEIVERYATKAGISIDPHDLRAQALRFALRRGTRSGRTARQFVDDLAGRLALETETPHVTH